MSRNHITALGTTLRIDWPSCRPPSDKHVLRQTRPAQMIRPVSDTAVPHSRRQSSVLSSPRYTRNLLAVSSATVLYTAPRARRGDQLGTDHIIAAAARWYAGWQAVRQIQRREDEDEDSLRREGNQGKPGFRVALIPSALAVSCNALKYPDQVRSTQYYTHTSQQPDSKLPPLEARPFRGFANGAGLLLILHPYATSMGPRQGYYHDQTPTPCWPRGPVGAPAGENHGGEPRR